YRACCTGTSLDGLVTAKVCGGVRHASSVSVPATVLIYTLSLHDALPICAVHSVVFGGFAAASLAARIDDAKPALMVTADGGSRMGKTVLYKSLVDEALKLARHRRRRC